MINFLIKIKKLKLYRFFLLYFLKPIYDLFWQYIINLKGKIYYFLWFSKKRNFIDLSNNDKKLVFDNENFKTLADKINRYCVNNLIKNSSEEILSGELTKSNPTNSGSRKYNQDLFPRLSNELQKEVFDLAHSDLLISTAAKYLKVFPILDKTIISHNIPNNPEDVRGAMLWHKDDFGYKSLDLFMAISDIDEFNGPLKVLKNKNKLGIFSKSNQENVQKNSIGERGKIKFDHFEKLENQNILTLEGKKGSSLLVDSFTAYHRGGHCIKNDRLMLRLSYQTPDAVRVYSKSGFHHEFEKLKDKLSLNFYLKFLYHQRPGEFLIFFRKYLMKFYRILHVKEN